MRPIIERRDTCPDCQTPNTLVCARWRCGSCCECYCNEPTAVSLGLSCPGCGAWDDCYCREP